jgi:NAD(P)-dependent dehydrogenase (short-subunit alcohol dehydrogenase family)
MSYFITGGTGFIGRRLIERLLVRDEPVFVLVRSASAQKFEVLKQAWGDRGSLVTPIAGDLAEPSLGVSETDRARLAGRIDHIFHLGAVYDLAATDESVDLANILGTDHALQFAAQVRAARFHLMSSIAAAGLYPGVFTEEMFAEAEGLEHPYFRTKHESESLVRRSSKVPWRIYRPAMVVGDSRTGVMDKVDGPYYLFKLIQKMRRAVPGWFPMIGFDGGYVNLVPVDFVVAALDHLAHLPDLDGHCFHLVDDRQRHVGEVLNVFAKAAHAPTMSVRLDLRLLEHLPQVVKAAVGAIRPIQRITDQILGDLGIPRSLMQLLAYPTRFDNRQASTLLAPAGIRVPPLEDYAWRLWDYWERHLDPELHVDRSLSGAVRGKVVVITGGSSGIGKATALSLAAAGARIVIAARDATKLDETRAEIEALGGHAFTYPCDLTDFDACSAFAERVLAEHGAVDILINNAGHSIRRSLEISYERFHDYERLMRLNYFAAVRLTLALLPSMVARKSGQVISISSIGVLSNSPRFSAYVASKAALEAFSRSAGAEVCDQGVQFTIVNLPLVRTRMIAPTQFYEHVPTISPEEAAGMVTEAIIYRPVRVATRLGIFAQILHLIAPKISQTIMNTGYQMFPDSAAARGVSEPNAQPSKEGVALTTLLRGLHW